MLLGKTELMKSVAARANSEFPLGSAVKNMPANAGDSGSIPGLEDLLKKEMVTHHSILAWKIPWSEEPGGLQSTGLQRS